MPLECKQSNALSCQYVGPAACNDIKFCDALQSFHINTAACLLSLTRIQAFSLTRQEKLIFLIWCIGFRNLVVVSIISTVTLALNKFT